MLHFSSCSAHAALYHRKAVCVPDGRQCMTRGKGIEGDDPRCRASFTLKTKVLSVSPREKLKSADWVPRRALVGPGAELPYLE